MTFNLFNEVYFKIPLSQAPSRKPALPPPQPPETVSLIININHHHLVSSSQGGISVTERTEEMDGLQDRSPFYVESSSKCCLWLVRIPAPDVLDFISRFIRFYLLPIVNVCVQVEPWRWPSRKQGSWGRGQQAKGERGEQFDFLEVLGIFGILGERAVG